MTKFVKENDDGQYEEEWHDVANQAASECTQTPHKFNPFYMSLRPGPGTPPARQP
jgi:hypothetical protein